MNKTKELILKKATRAFSEKGYQLASLQDIAIRSELSKAGVFHYFKTKENILGEILLNHSDTFISNLKETINDNNARGLSCEESFKKIIKTYAKLVNNDRDQRLIVLRERHQLTNELKKELLKRERAIFHIIKAELNKFPNIGSKTDQNIITFIIISMSHWLGYWYKKGKGESLEAIIDKHIDIIFHGMFKEEDDGARSAILGGAESRVVKTSAARNKANRKIITKQT